MSDTSVRREKFLPYAYERTLALEVTACTRDDGAQVALENRTVMLWSGWQTAEIEFTARLPATSHARLVPPGERAAPPLAVLVALRCEATRLRRGEVFALVDDACSDVLRVRRDELHGTAELVAWVVRTKSGGRRVAGYASDAGLRVAQAPPWSLEVDRPAPTAGRGFEVLFKSFAQDAAIPPRERANLYRLDAAQAVPVLWLNADHGEIADLLRAEGTRGARARLRDVAFERIVSAVRLQLILRAAAHLTAGEAVYPWETTVLDEALARLYPKVAATDRLARMRDELTDPAELVSRLDDATQAHEHTADALRKAIEDA